MINGYLSNFIMDIDECIETFDMNVNYELDMLETESFISFYWRDRC